MGTIEKKLLNSLLHKLIIGIKDWTAEELQFYKNNAALVEQRLHDYSEDVFVAPYAEFSYLERCLMRKQLGVKRIISKPTAILLSLYASYQDKDETVAIVVIENDCFDVGLFGTGSGVFEELRLRHGSVDTLTKSCDSIMQSVEHSIDSLLIVHNGDVDPYIIKQIEACFKLKATLRSGLQDLLVRGAYVLSGVLYGIVSNCLLIPLQQYPIYCEFENGDAFELLKPNVVPTRHETTITTQIGPHNRNLWIRERCNEYNSSPLAFLRLPYSKLSSNRECKVKITLDIDANYKLNIKIVDLDSNNEYSIKYLVWE